jgi:phage-related holin
MKILSVVALLFIKITLLPSIPLLFYMTVAMSLDFITGIIKAIILKEIRTSAGYRKTIIKFLQYGGSIAIGIILANAGNGRDAFKSIVGYFNDGLLIFIIYIEVTSIFENIYAIDKSSMMSRFFIAPILKILTWQIKNNPLINQLGDASKKIEGDGNSS